jgi:hypothetical protein
MNTLANVGCGSSLQLTAAINSVIKSAAKPCQAFAARDHNILKLKNQKSSQYEIPRMTWVQYYWKIVILLINDVAQRGAL